MSAYSDPSVDEEADEVARRPDRQLPEGERRGRPLGERRLPGQVDQGDGRVAEAEARERRHRWAGESIAAVRGGAPIPERRGVSASSEPLPQVGRDRRVVAQRLVQVPGIGTVVARGDLGERRAELAPDPLGLVHQQVADAPLADAGVDDEGHDPDDPVGVLEARQRVEGDEPEDVAVAVGDDDLRVLRGEPREAIDDVARAPTGSPRR